MPRVVDPEKLALAFKQVVAALDKATKDIAMLQRRVSVLEESQRNAQEIPKMD